MVAGQRRGVLGEVVDEGGGPQLVAHQLLEDVLHDLAGHGVVVQAGHVDGGQVHIFIIGKFGANEYRGKLSPQITVCLIQEDYNILQEKYGLLDNRNEKIEENAKFMMSKLATTKSIDDFFLFSEAYTIIIIGTSDLNKLNPKIINKVVKQLIHSVCQFLY